MEVKKIEIEKVWEVRYKVMYPEKDLEYVKLESDMEGTHLGLYKDSKLVSVISIFFENNELQFRKFATLTEEQGKGYGSILLNEVIKYAGNKKFNKVWCNSRIEKVGFYEKFGFVKTDKEYEKDGRKFIIIEKKL